MKTRCIVCDKIANIKTDNYKDICIDNETVVWCRDRICSNCGESWTNHIYYRKPKLRKITRRRFKWIKKDY